MEQLELFKIEKPAVLTKEEQLEIIRKFEEQMDENNPYVAPEKTRIEVSIVDFEYIGDVSRKRGKLESMMYPKYRLTDKYGRNMFWVSTGDTPIFQTPFNAKVTVYGHTGGGRYVKNLKITG